MKKGLKILGIILLVILVLFLIWNFAYSKYLENIEVQTLSKVALPKIYFQSEEVQNIQSLNTDIVSYEFSVKNYDETISDVGFNYNLIIEYSQENAPVLITLYREKEGTEEKIELIENKTVNFETIGTLEQENFYRLELSYDKSSSEILDENFKISVCLEAIQEEV